MLKLLTENEYPQKQLYSTKDYYHCNEILKLNKYTVRIKQYPNFNTFSPFIEWKKEKPTQSIPWYDMYNSVKHNRGDNIIKANLENTINAVASIHILLEAQYGKHIFNKFHQHTDAKSVFETTSRPSWDCDEIQLPIFEGYNSHGKWLGKIGYFSTHHTPTTITNDPR
jgi:hypothetical protein